MLLSLIRRNLASLPRNVLKLTEIQSRNVGFHLTRRITAPFVSHNLNLMIKRYKSKKQPSKNVEAETESEDDSRSDEEVQDRHSKIVKTTVNSLRMDSVLKSGLGMARNKIEMLFYDSKIRLNGEKVPKKSKNVKVGDEIDIIKGVDVQNPEFLVVSRVEVLQALPYDDNFKVKLRRTKSLTIENYKDNWKGGPVAP